MCLGVPGRLVEIWQESGTRMARADFAGEERRVCLAYLPELVEGDYVMAHMGFALTKVDEKTAASTVEIMKQYGVLFDETPEGSTA